MGKLNWGSQFCAPVLLCAAVAIASPAHMLTTWDSFDFTDGAYPYAGLVQATNGNLYGTTVEGGANKSGTVFKIAPGGKLTTLYSFCSQNNCSDGARPSAALVQATNGEPPRDYGRGRDQQVWHGIQNHPKWQADDALQLLLAKRLHGRRGSQRARPGHQWEPLRDYVRGRGQDVPHLGVARSSKSPQAAR